jgi:hypothetical protein
MLAPQKTFCQKSGSRKLKVSLVNHHLVAQRGIALWDMGLPTGLI